MLRPTRLLVKVKWRTRCSAWSEKTEIVEAEYVLLFIDQTIYTEKKIHKKKKNIGRLISNKTLSETNHTDGQRIHMSTKEYSMRITEMKAHKTVHTENACCIWTVHAILLA